MTSIFEVNENNRTKSSIKLDTQHDFTNKFIDEFVGEKRLPKGL